MTTDSTVHEEVTRALEGVRADIAALLKDSAGAGRPYKLGLEHSLGIIDSHVSDPLPLAANSAAVTASVARDKLSAAALYIHYLREALSAKDSGSTARPELRPECYEAGRLYYSLVARDGGAEPQEVGL